MYMLALVLRHAFTIQFLKVPRQSIDDARKVYPASLLRWRATAQKTTLLLLFTLLVILSLRPSSFNTP